MAPLFFQPSKLMMSSGMMNKGGMITGSMVAIVTPMQEDGSLDMAAFRGLIDFHIAQGTDGIAGGRHDR